MNLEFVDRDDSFTISELSHPLTTYTSEDDDARSLALARPRRNSHATESSQNSNPSDVILGANQLPSVGGAAIKDGVLQREKGANSRRHSEYVVLTPTHLLRFDDFKDAYDQMQLIDRESQDKEVIEKLPNVNILLVLSDVIAVYEVIKGQSFRIDYQPRDSSDLQHVQLFASSLSEHRIWMCKIRHAVRARGMDAVSIQYLEQRMIQDELKAKDELRRPTVSYKVLIRRRTPRVDSTIPAVFVLSKNSIYLYPLVHGRRNADSVESYGLLAVRQIRMEGYDDSIQFVFRRPYGDERQLCICSSAWISIIQELQAAIDAFTLHFPETPYVLDLPSDVSCTADEIMSLYKKNTSETIPSTPTTTSSGSCNDISTAFSGFTQQLSAFCTTMEVDRKRLAVKCTRSDLQQPGERVTIRPPTTRMGPETYTFDELIAIFHSLRYCGITDVCFNCGSLASLEVHKVDQGGDAKICAWLQGLDVLSRELYFMIVFNPNLKRLGLVNCNFRNKIDSTSTIAIVGQALKSATTGLERLNLSGNVLNLLYLNVLLEGIRLHPKPIRGLDLSNTHLRETGMSMLLQTIISKYPRDLEYLDLSHNSLNVPIRLLSSTFSKLKSLRVLRLTNIDTDLLQLPPLPANSLQEIVLSNTPIASFTIQNLCTYIESHADSLKSIDLTNCRISGRKVSKLIHAIAVGGKLNVRLALGANPVTRDPDSHARLVRSIRKNEAPRELLLPSVEWTDSQLCGLLSAVSINFTIQVLDISRPVLAHDISDGAVSSFRNIFERNTTLQEFDVSGDVSGDETVYQRLRYGARLAEALEGLQDNKTLSKLNISGNNLEDAGAVKLADVLKVNTGLTNIRMDDNKVEQLGFTALHIAIKSNRTLTHFEHPAHDMERFNAQMIAEAQAFANQEAALKRGKHLAIRNQNRKLANFTEAREATEELIRKINKMMTIIQERTGKNRKWRLNRHVTECNVDIAAAYSIYDTRPDSRLSSPNEAGR